MNQRSRSRRGGVRASILAWGLALAAFVAGAPVASAHVGVLPGEAPIDTNQAFVVRVPNERTEPTVKVRVEVPDGLVVSRARSKPGWIREFERDDQQRITAITWTGGLIGEGEYDDFAFIARTPKETGTLTFRNYQTYQGGETVEWVNAQGQERSAAFVELTEGTTGSGP